MRTFIINIYFKNISGIINIFIIYEHNIFDGKVNIAKFNYWLVKDSKQ